MVRKSFPYEQARRFLPRVLIRVVLSLCVAIAVTACSSGSSTTTEIDTLATEAAEPTTTTPTTVRPVDSWADVVEQVRPSVVRIEIDTCNNESGVGSGFAIGDWIVTNRHVVEGYRNLVVVDADGSKELPKQVRVSSSLDLALIQVSQSRPLAWTTTNPRIGDEVAALGFPRGIGFSFTRGSISALDVRVDDADFSVSGLLQTDAAVNPGNSGGPLIDKEGNVLGVVVLKRNDSEGLAFAIDGRQVQVFLSGQKGDPYEPCAEIAPDPTVGVTPDSQGSESVPETSPQNVDGPTPESVVVAFYDAVAAGDFELAWELGGKNLGKNPSFDAFVAGYDQTESSRVTIIGVNGDQVQVEVVALERTNKGPRVSTYLGTYTVTDEEITTGKLKLSARES